jgi:hypothetical protein
MNDVIIGNRPSRNGHTVVTGNCTLYSSPFQLLPISAAIIPHFVSFIGCRWPFDDRRACSYRHAPKPSCMYTIGYSIRLLAVSCMQIDSGNHHH